MISGLIISYFPGLGDNFVTCGIANFMSQFYDKVIVLYQLHYHKTLTTLYRDNQKVVFNIFTTQFDKHKLDFLKTKFELDEIKILHLYDDHSSPIRGYEKRLYQNAKIPYSVRYDFFNAPRNIDESKKLYAKLSQNEPYCLVSPYSSAGRCNLKINTPHNIIEIKPGITENMMHFLDLIYNAEEIHCVDSSFYHLVESLNLEKQKFFHCARYAEHKDVNMILEPSESWKIIEY